MASNHAIAIDIGRRRLRAVLASPQRSTIRIRQVLVEDMPEGLDVGDAEALGGWVGECLRSAGFPRGEAIFALAREHVGLKRMMLPSTDDVELPQMTRLALKRELPFDAENAVIDYVPVEHTEAGTTVLAVAVPEEVLERTRRVAAAAGLEIGRISLRAMGSAALLRSLGSDPAETVLAVDITGESVEFCIVSGGIVRFSRAAEASGLTETGAIAESVITETRRTWMSYRIVEETSEVSSAVVIGDRLVSEQTARPIGEMLKVNTEILDSHPLVEAQDNVMDRLWPLAGLLLEPVLELPTIDFAHPRRGPDIAGQKRRRALIAVGAVLVLIVAAWTMGKLHLRGLRTDLEYLRSQRAGLATDDYRYQRDGAKLEHLRQWETARADWTAHLRFLNEILPPANEVVLDSWTGSLSFRGVKYDRAAAGNKWSAPKELAILVDGEAKDRATADALREALVRTEWYVTSSSGTDAQGGRRLPFGFKYRLQSVESAPPIEGEQNAGDATGSSGGEGGAS
ncbi:MAG: pilus assembly protein PilM [Phycisphaerales bacterium]|nr:MAG: pilus assembly protein PilM [Phycisphaerales bacterium]